MKRIPLLKLIFLSCLFLFAACRKDSPEPDVPYVGNGYIRGNFGSEYLNYTEPEFYYSGGDTTSHSYNPNINGGSLTLMRKGVLPDKRKWQLAIYYIDLDNMPIPIEFSSTQPPQSDFGSLTYGGFGIRDSSIPSHITIDGPEDSYNYWGQTSGDVKIRVTSKKNDILEGTFEGKVRTASGLVKEVTEGEFRVKILRVR